MYLRISVVMAAAFGVRLSLRRATAAKKHLAKSLHAWSVHKHNWYHWLTLQCTCLIITYAHTLSYHLTGASKEEAEKGEKRRLERTTQSLHAHWKNEDRDRTQKPVSLDMEGIHLRC